MLRTRRCVAVLSDAIFMLPAMATSAPAADRDSALVARHENFGLGVDGLFSDYSDTAVDARDGAID